MHTQALSIAGQIIAGLCIFVLGLTALRRGLRSIWSARAGAVLASLVKTPGRGFLTGIGATILTQSSAVVTVMSMALVGAGALTFADTVGIVLGTNIGSTFTVGLLSIDLARFGPALVAIGIGGFFAARLFIPKAYRERAGAVTVSLTGFGTLFVGFSLILSAVRPLATSPTLYGWLLLARAHPLLGVLAGTVVTATIGSSSASTALVLALAESSSFPLQASIALVLGNNIGTCVTAVLASIGGNRDVKRVAATHVLLNVAGAAAFLPLLTPFSDLVRAITTDRGAQVAAAHFFYNVVCSLAALPFARGIARGLTRLLP